MNILIFNTNNPLKVSGIVAFDLFNHLKSRGHQVKLLVNCFNSDYPEGIISLESSFSVRWKTIKAKFIWRLSKLKKILKFKEELQRDSDYCFFQLDERKLIYKTRRLLKISEIKPDVIIVLYAKKFINVKNVYQLYKRTHAKIFWLMYDMAPFTGGCHYAWECKGYQNNCGNCPGLFSSDPFDISYRNLLYKKIYIDNTNIQIIAGSERQYRQAKASSLFLNKPIHKIYTSIDLNVFKPCNRQELRSRMGIPINKKAIFFGSIELKERRKGMTYLVESLIILKDKIKNTNLENEIILLIAGSKIKEITEYLPFDYHFFGMLDNNTGIASAYQAADIFVCPSIEDSGPTMINQSLMCGTPVVCFEMGVGIDFVINGETGFCVKLKDSIALAQAMYDILIMGDSDYLRIKENCRNLALRLFQPDVTISNWIKVLSENN